MARLIDTSVFIELERRGLPLGILVEGHLDESFAIASITASELLYGVERADTIVRRQRRSAFVEAVLATVTVFPFDLVVARVHAELWAELEGRGQRIGPYDLLVAASAIAHDYQVVTRNVREFERIPGLVVHLPDWET